ncbi:MAG: hypothetical protein ACYDG5_02805 [Dehalococcoidales bacterium]
MWYNMIEEKVKDYRLKALAYFGIGGGLLGYSIVSGVLYPLSITALGVFFILIAAVFLVNTLYEHQGLSKVLAVIESVPIGYFSFFLITYGISKYLINVHLENEGIVVAIIAYGIFGSTIGKILGRDLLRPAFKKINVFQPSIEIPNEFKDKGWGL